MVELGRRRVSYEMKGEKRLAHVHALVARVRGYALPRISNVYKCILPSTYLRCTANRRERRRAAQSNVNPRRVILE